MNSMQKLKSWLCGGCVYYTVISILLLLIDLILNGSENGGLTVLVSLLTLPCALCISAAGLLQNNDKISQWVRVLSHFLVTILSVFLFLFLPMNPGMRPVNALLLFVLLTVLYWVGFGIVHLIRTCVRRFENDD